MQPARVDVTVIVATIGDVPVLTAGKEGTFPVPLDAIPMAGFEFVQLKLAPAGTDEKLDAGTALP